MKPRVIARQLWSSGICTNLHSSGMWWFKSCGTKTCGECCVRCCIDAPVAVLCLIGPSVATTCLEMHDMHMQPHDTNTPPHAPSPRHVLAHSPPSLVFVLPPSSFIPPQVPPPPSPPLPFPSSAPWASHRPLLMMGPPSGGGGACPRWGGWCLWCSAAQPACVLLLGFASGCVG